MKKWNWKKTLAALCASACAIGAGGLQGLSAAADLEMPAVQVLALGDDCLVAGSDGTSATAIAADYLGGTAVNRAEIGQTSAELVEQLQNDADVQADVQDADVIFVSIGVNDLLNTVYFENPCITDASSYSTMSEMLSNLPSSSATLIITQVITTLPDCVEELNANLQETISLIRTQNANADIVIQNVINPMAVNIGELNLSNKRAVAATELFYYLDVCLNGGSYTSSNVGEASKMTIDTGINTVIHALDSRANVSVADYYTAFVGEDKQESMGFVLTDLANLQVTYTPVGQVFLASALLESTSLLSNGDGSVITAAYDATGQRSSLQTERASMDATIQAAESRTRVTYSLGDIDGDSSVGTQDAYLTLLQYSGSAAGGDNSLNPAQRIAADADNDGSITTQDAFLWLKYYSLIAAGSDTSLETYLQENGRS